MTLSYTYDGGALTTVRRGTVELTQSAYLGQVGSGHVTVNDAAGTLEIIGQKDFAVDETACADPISFRGYVDSRTLKRGPSLPGRDIDVSLVDLNATMGFRLFHTVAGFTPEECGDPRPAETVDERMAWLMASPFVAGSVHDAATLFIDNGRIASSTNVMDETSYRNQYPSDVIADCVQAAIGFNYYVRDFGDGPELVFRDDNTSTVDSSTLRISNVMSDVIGDALTFYPSKDATLARDPSNVYSVLGFTWAKGSSILGRPATETAFNGWRSAVVSNSNIKTAVGALAQSAQLLWQHSTEEDVIEVTILVPASAANLVNHGDRIQARFAHFGNTGGRDYDEFTWFRVAELTRTPLLKPVRKYQLHLKLSPQEEPCPTDTFAIRQHAESVAETDGFADFPVPVLAGSLILVRLEWHPASGDASGGMAMEVGAGYTSIAQGEARGENNAGVAVFAKDAAGGEQHINRDQGITGANAHLCVYEITGAAVADIEFVSASRQTSTSNPKTLSAHASASGLAFDTFIAVHVEGGLDRTWTGGPGNADWTEHYDQGPTTGPTEFPGTNWKPPWIWEGNATPTGASLTPSVSLTPPVGKTLSEWAGISVLIRGDTCT